MLHNTIGQIRAEKIEEMAEDENEDDWCFLVETGPEDVVDPGQRVRSPHMPRKLRAAAERALAGVDAAGSPWRWRGGGRAPR